jgi:hypothetical protein
MRARTVKETIQEGLKEAIGAGFSVSKNLGGARRGMGFGSASASNNYSPYTYSIMPLNHSLETEPTTNDRSTEKIHIGQLIKGKEINQGEDFYEGNIIDTKKCEISDDILYYIIVDSINKKKRKIDPNTVTILNPTEVTNSTEVTDEIDKQYIRQ